MMKQSLGILLMFGFSLSLKAQTSISQANSGTYLKAPTAPVEEICGYITMDNGAGGTFQTHDTACEARNKEKQRNYSAQVLAYNQSTRLASADASTIVKPKEPENEDCNASGFADYTCQRRNQDRQRDYNLQLSAWNKMQQEQAVQNQAEQSEAQRRALAEAKANSATEALQKAQEQNLKSAKKSNTAATITTGISVGFAAAYAASCSGGATCNYGYLASSMAFGLMSAQNSRQAAQNKASAYSACTTQAQLNATSANDCSALDPETSSITTPKTFDSNGNCVAVDKTICEQIKANLPPGTNIKDLASKINTFTTDAPYKLNADGSATTKDGKTFKPEAFKSKESLMAAGLTPDQAAAAMNALANAGGLALPSSAREKAAADLKADGKANELGAFAVSGSGSEEGVGANGAGLGSSGALGAKAIGDSSGIGKGRNPAGAGLTRDFNGETIGAAGDDIFSMMNRRYKVKTAQDSFISN